MKKLIAAICKTIDEYRVDFAECNGLGQSQPFYVRYPNAALQAANEKKIALYL